MRLSAFSFDPPLQSHYSHLSAQNSTGRVEFQRIGNQVTLSWEQQTPGSCVTIPRGEVFKAVETARDIEIDAVRASVAELAALLIQKCPADHSHAALTVAVDHEWSERRRWRLQPPEFAVAAACLNVTTNLVLPETIEDRVVVEAMLDAQLKAQLLTIQDVYRTILQQIVRLN